MKVLVVGGGGREHALVWKISQSPRVKNIFCAPGNAGISKLATCVNISAEDIQGLVCFAEKEEIDLTVVGPEVPLVAGIVDEFEKRGLKIFGPNKKAAQIEGSKVFSKNLMKKYNIPTAAYEVFVDFNKAVDFIEKIDLPVVIKAEGLAAGKGVKIAQNKDEAILALNDIMKNKTFGSAGNRVIIEEYLEGPEVTVLSFCDGRRAYPMVSSKDYKRVFDGQKGPNTGGMGAISPAPYYGAELAQVVEESIIQKTMKAMKKEKIPFKGILYTGLILTDKGPKVLEYNCRFGDPETQVVIPRLETDLIDIMEHSIEGDLSPIKIKWKKEKAACVVLASGGYPEKYNTGKIITGIDEAQKSGAIVFHAGTGNKDGKIVTTGGRVLGVTAMADSLDDAVKKAYGAVEKIQFDKMHYRRDIGE